MKKLTLVTMLALFASSSFAKQVNTPIGLVEAELLAVTAAGTFVVVNLAGNAQGSTLPSKPGEPVASCKQGESTSHWR